MFLFSEADCDSHGKCQVFVIHIQGNRFLMKRQRPGWMRPGDSLTLGGFFPDTAQRLRADLGTAGDERHFHLRKYFVVV